MTTATMLIDPNPQTRGPANTQIPLSPELAKLVADLKLSIGQSLDAMVTRVQAVTEAERQELLAQQPATPKNQAQRQMQSLLQEPALKLVELKIQQSLVPTLTALPLAKAQTLQVLLTTRGLMLVPPPQTTSPDLAETEAHPAITASKVAATLTTAANIAITKSGAAPTLPIPGGAGQASTAQVTPAHSGNLTSTNNSTSTGPAVPFTAAASRQPQSPIVETGSPKLDVAPPKPDIPTARTEPNSKFQPAAPAHPMPVSQIRSLIAETLVRTLPHTMGPPPLLKSLGELHRQLQEIPSAKLPAQLRELQSLLNKLPGLTLNLAQLNPTRPEALRQALEQSGVFYERRLLQSVETGAHQAARKLPEQDLKGLLILIQQWLSATPAPTPNRMQMPDSLSQLLFGLVQIFLPRQKPQPTTNALVQLKAAMQQQVGQSLARIQTQQMRTLNNQLLDPDAPQQWHLDIPLRLPEGYGNLYLHLFEPRLPPEPEKEPEKKEPRRQSKARWRVFLELMLDELGGLSAEISVLEKDLEITLWTEGSTLRERANAHLRELKQDLEQQGMVVRELQCSQHPPPAQKVQLDYALIDIKT